MNNEGTTFAVALTLEREGPAWKNLAMDGVFVEQSQHEPRNKAQEQLTAFTVRVLYEPPSSEWKLVRMVTFPVIWEHLDLCLSQFLS